MFLDDTWYVQYYVVFVQPRSRLGRNTSARSSCFSLVARGLPPWLDWVDWTRFQICCCARSTPLAVARFQAMVHISAYFFSDFGMCMSSMLRSVWEKCRGGGHGFWEILLDLVPKNVVDVLAIFAA